MYSTKYNTEYFLVRELFLNAGGILGFLSLLLIVGITKDISNLKIMFFLILIAISFITYISSTLKIKEN